MRHMEQMQDAKWCLTVLMPRSTSRMGSAVIILARLQAALACSNCAVLGLGCAKQDAAHYLDLVHRRLRILRNCCSTVISLRCSAYSDSRVMAPPSGRDEPESFRRITVQVR